MRTEMNVEATRVDPEPAPVSGEAVVLVRLSVPAPPSRGPAVERAASAWLRLLDAPGALLWIAALALAGGALIHARVDRLPASYSWSLPFRTLREVISKPAFPAWALAAFLTGTLASGSWRISGLRSGFTVSTRIRSATWTPERRIGLLLALLASLTALALDLIYFPSHGWATAVVAAMVAPVAVVRTTPRRAVEALINVALGVIVFAAVCYWFTIIKTLTFSGSAPWDARILSFEKAIFGVYPHRWLAGIVAAHPSWLAAMDRTYFAIFEHMAIGSCFLLGLGDHAERGRYLGALCLCYVLGAPLYLLMPAAGPAYFDGATYGFLRQQYLVVNYVQGLLYRNTAGINEGTATSIQTWGYIACMPSLHMAHELVMLYFARRSRVFFLGTLVFFVLTAVSVVGLGWHYPTDIAAGMALGAVAIWLSGRLGARMFPRPLRSAYVPGEASRGGI